MKVKFGQIMELRLTSETTVGDIFYLATKVVKKLLALRYLFGWPVFLRGFWRVVSGLVFC